MSGLSLKRWTLTDFKLPSAQRKCECRRLQGLRGLLWNHVSWSRSNVQFFRCNLIKLSDCCSHSWYNRDFRFPQSSMLTLVNCGQFPEALLNLCLNLGILKRSLVSQESPDWALAASSWTDVQVFEVDIGTGPPSDQTLFTGVMRFFPTRTLPNGPKVQLLLLISAPFDTEAAP